VIQELAPARAHIGYIEQTDFVVVRIRYKVLPPNIEHPVLKYRSAHIQTKSEALSIRVRRTVADKSSTLSKTMSLSNLMGLLQKYASGGAANTANAEQDFEKVSQAAPQPHLASGLAEAFRSNETPPFGQMLSTLFSNSNGQQQAGILNHLLSAVGPGAASGVLGSLLGGGSQVTPEQAQQVPPQAVHELAEQAQRNDPSIIDRAGEFYAQHPTLVKALGAGSLAYIMSHMSSRS